jgi:hypothetical protein
MADNTEQESLYDAKGQSLFLGWQHIYPLIPDADFLFGGFVIANVHKKLQPAAMLGPVGPQKNHRFKEALFDRGVEIALRFKL